MSLITDCLKGNIPEYLKEVAEKEQVTVDFLVVFSEEGSRTLKTLWRFRQSEGS